MIDQDKNFDDLITNFRQRIYDSDKGSWRLKILTEDLQPKLPDKSMQVFDAGCGLGQFGLWLAQKGHSLTLCDISSKMLEEAKKSFSENGCEANFYHGSFQAFDDNHRQYELVVFHAVIEWLANPLEGLQTILSRVKPGGYLSFMFYNRNAMVYANVLKGQWRLKPILEDTYIGKGNKLSPPYPQYPYEMERFIKNAGFNIEVHSGIRVFHDYLSEGALENTEPDELFELEKRYCRMPVYRDMGRYVHMLCKNIN